MTAEPFGPDTTSDGSEPVDRFDRYRALVDTDHPAELVGLVRYLSHLRSAVLIGRALHDKYPTEAAWQELLCSRAFLELVDEVVAFVADLRYTLEQAGNLIGVQEIHDAVNEEYPRALEAVQELATALGVPPEDLLSVVMEA